MKNKALYAVAVAVLAVVSMGASCPGGKPGEPGEPTKPPVQLPEQCKGITDPVKLLICINSVVAPFLPTPSAPPNPEPRVTPTSPPAATATSANTVAPTPHPTPTNAPSERLMPTEKLADSAITCVCSKFDNHCAVPMDKRPDPTFVKELRTAIKECVPEGRRTLFPAEWNTYYACVVVKLRTYGMEAVIDDCGNAICTERLCPTAICGEIVISAGGTAIGKGSSEGYNILVSSGDLRDPISGGGFRGTCSPKWFK